MAAGVSEGGDEPAPRPRDPAKPFDILQTYLNLLNTIPPQQPALAAITALTSALSQHHFSTATEVFSLLDDLAKELKSQVADHIPLSAGTDLFLYYLINDFARSRGETTDFERTTEDVKVVGQRFVQRGLQARRTIKRFGRRLIRDGMTVVIPEIDELAMVSLWMLRRLTLISASFLLVVRDVRTWEEIASTMISLGRGLENPPSNRSGISTGKVTVLASAAAILSTGAIWSSPSVLQTAMLAKTLNFQVVVPSEMLKLVMWTLSGQNNPRLQWRHNGDSTAESKHHNVGTKMIVTVSVDILIHACTAQRRRAYLLSRWLRNCLKFCCFQAQPAYYVTQFLTENGDMVPAAVAEEAIKIWL